MAPKDVEEQLAREEKAHWQAIAQSLRSLRASEGWDTYRGELEQAEFRLQEQLMACSKDEFDRIRGQIDGLRLAYRIPEQIIAKTASL
jgi:rubrerythrin